MGRILLFDDWGDQEQAVRGAVEKELGEGVSVAAFVPDDGPVTGLTYEQHIERKMSSEAGETVDLIACDKELGMYRSYPGLSANAVSVVARNLGIPFCQYSRHPKANKREIDRYNALKRWNAEEITLSGNDVETWAKEIAELWRGFEAIRTGYKNSKVAKSKPADALAAIMGRESAASRIALYGSGDQSVLTEVFAFVDEGDHTELVRRLPRVLGTWLRLSLLRFPGLLVNETAAASYLNVRLPEFQSPEIQGYFSGARYEGPLRGLGKWWWRDDLECLLLEAEALDGNDYLAKNGKQVGPCIDEETGERAGYYCMITETPVSRANSKGNINWFPSGADLARIRNSKFDQITSLVSV